MSFNAMMASDQWARRPSDERFWDLNELQDAVDLHKQNAVMATTEERNLRVEVDGESLSLVGKTGQAASVSHWAFGQLASRAGAPASFLRELPPTLAANVLNNRLAVNARSDRSVQLLVNNNGGYLVRSIASEIWAPIWNADIVRRIRRIADGGCWAPPPAMPTIGWTGDRLPEDRIRIASAEDQRRSLVVKEGDEIGPAGLYASAEDMFVFLTNPNSVIRDGSAEGLQRGFIVQNAEVCGKLSFKLFTFFLRGTCSNHIIWNPSGVTEIRVKHTTTAPDRAFRQIGVTVQRYADASAHEDEMKIQAAQTRTIAGTRDEVIDGVFKRNILTRTAADAAYTLAENNSDTDGDPRSFWGFAQGITRLSQTLATIDARTAMDQSAGRLLTAAVG